MDDIAMLDVDADMGKVSVGISSVGLTQVCMSVDGRRQSLISSLPASQGPLLLRNKHSHSKPHSKSHSCTLLVYASTLSLKTYLLQTLD
mmetsp:Transcript_5216/g.14050  ORF Transcript_5216/g.14050 Transcript_5216/m.14050 type:complete len:89 (-) Transcript_5216:1018-1284(-)